MEDGESVQVSASLGVATLRPGETVDQLIARADLAMYEAKNRGRGHVRLAS